MTHKTATMLRVQDLVQKERLLFGAPWGRPARLGTSSQEYPEDGGDRRARAVPPVLPPMQYRQGVLPRIPGAIIHLGGPPGNGERALMRRRSRLPMAITKDNEGMQPPQWRRIPFSLLPMMPRRRPVNPPPCRCWASRRGRTVRQLPRVRPS